MPSTFARPGVVLDTNVLLDWLVFREPSVAALAGAIDSGRLDWASCAPMRAELAQMLGHASLAAWAPDAGAALSTFDRLACPQPTPAALSATRPRCTDPDDQIFLDLALTVRAHWLITRDKALLKLARRARALGLEICTPAAWAGAATRPAPASR